MASGKNKKNKRNKIEGSTAGLEATSTPQPARGGRGKGVGQAPGRTGRPKGTNNKPEKPGRVAAIGVDVPSLDDVLKGPESVSEPAKGRGRPTGYRPEYAAIALAMCKLGASDLDLAEEFSVDTSTIWHWRCKHEEFFNALSEGKDAWDDRIERGLAMRAAGYSVHTEKLFHYEGTIVRAQTIEHFPPDIGAIKMWLGNRRPAAWKDKQEVKIDGSDAFLRLWHAISDGTAEKMLGN